MSLLDQAGKEAAQEISTGAQAVAGKVSDVGQTLGVDLADAVSVVAGSIDRLAEMGGSESAAWRVELAAWRDILERGLDCSLGGMPLSIKPKPRV